MAGGGSLRHGDRSRCHCHRRPASDDGLVRAVELILANPGKVVATGIGKSGHIARKSWPRCAAPAPPPSSSTRPKRCTATWVFTRPATPPWSSPRTAARRSAGAGPAAAPVPVAAHRHPGQFRLAAGRHVDVLLDASVEREADPHNLAPTASAIVALSIGDALAIALMCARRFTPEEFGVSTRRPTGAQPAALRGRGDARPRGIRLGGSRNAAEGRHHRHDPAAPGRRVRGGDRWLAGGLPDGWRFAPSAGRLTTTFARFRPAT